MKKINSIKALFLISLVTLLGASPLLAGQIGASKTSGRYYEPVEVPAKLLSDILNTDLKKIAVYSFKDSAFSPILYQIDEVTPDGDFVLTHGPENNADKGNGALDKQDLIVFMARDSGDICEGDQTPPGSIKTVPVELIDTVTSDTSWVYISSFNDNVPDSNLPPVSRLVDKNNYHVRFPTYSYDGLTNKREKESMPTIFINKLSVLPEAGGNNKNIIDRQKIRGEITFLGGIVNVPINEKIVSGGLVAYKAGPVRIISHSCMYPLFPLGIKGPRFFIDSIMVDTLTLTSTIVNVPFDPGSLIHDMTLVFATDLSPDAKGMLYYNSENMDGFKIDGKMDDKEKAFKEEKDKWRLVTGPQGTQIQSTVFDNKFMADGTATSTYNDDESDPHPPENFVGDIGAAADRINIKSLATDSYVIKTFGCVPYNFYDPNGLNTDYLNSILNISNSPLQVKVGDKTIENKGGMQRAVISE
jgi:hypothetical protein